MSINACATWCLNASDVASVRQAVQFFSLIIPIFSPVLWFFFFFFFFLLLLNHRAGLCYSKTIFNLDYKTATRYDGCNNILSPLNIKADNNYYPILADAGSFSAKHVLLLTALGNQTSWILDITIKMSLSILGLWLVK